MSNAKTVGEAIERAVGIYTRKSGSLGSQQTIHMRGLSGSRVLLLRDGRPIRNLLTGQIDLGKIPIDNIEKIEILRGTLAARYGGQAQAGVIYIHSKRNLEEPPVAHVTADYGTFSSQLYKLKLGLPKNRFGPFDYYLTLGRSLSNGFRDNQDFDANNGSFHIGTDTGRWGKFNVDIESDQSEIGLPGVAQRNGRHVLPEQFDGTLEKGAATPLNRQNDRGNALHATYEVSPYNHSLLRFRLYGSRDRQEIIATTRTISTISQIRGLEAQWNVVPGVTLGYVYEKNKLSNLEIALIKEEKYSIYGSWFEQWNEHWSTNLDVRHDDSSIDEAVTSPRLGITWDWKPGIRLNTHIGRSFRNPTFSERGLPVSHPNRQIQMEKTWHGDFGMEMAWRKSIVSQLTYFRSNTDNSIVKDTSDQLRAVNLDESYAQGVEWQIRHPISSFAQHILNYTFTQSKVKRQGSPGFQKSQRQPDHLLHSILDLNLKKNVSLRSTVDYIGEQIVSNFDGSDPFALRSYGLWSLRLGKKILAAELYALAENITDNHYATNALPIELGNGFIPMMGRTFWVGIDIRFHS